MENRIRIGQVSSIDYKKGLIKVLFQDRDETVTDELPILTFNDEYKMPEIGAYVVTLHLSNGAEAGYVLGTFWDGSNLPAKGQKGIYRKELANEQGKAFFEYDKDTGELVIHADKVFIDSTVTVRKGVTVLEP
jgi:phage baseplate assembly protein gpV